MLSCLSFVMALHPTARLISRGTSTHTECLCTGQGTVRRREPAGRGAPTTSCQWMTLHSSPFLPRGHFCVEQELTEKDPAREQAIVGTS